MSHLSEDQSRARTGYSAIANSPEAVVDDEATRNSDEIGALYQDNTEQTFLQDGSQRTITPVNKPPFDTKKLGKSVTLHRSYYILVLAVLYSAFATPPWILICFMSKRPLTVASYNATGIASGGGRTNAFRENEEYYRTARVLRAVVNALAIPMATAVCASAALIYTQRRNSKQGTLTMRQVMVLADKGWISLPIIAKLLNVFNLRVAWRRYYSTMLLTALLLSLLAALTAPVQEAFLSQRSIKVPYLANASSIPNSILRHAFEFKSVFALREVEATTIIRSNLRSRLVSSTRKQTDLQLWPGGHRPCAYDWQLYCPPTFGDLNSLPDPFFAQLPNSTNVGTIYQYIPRVNSRAIHGMVQTGDDDFAKCVQDNSTFQQRFVGWRGNVSIERYALRTAWQMDICMPGNASISPWVAQSTPQTFNETVFWNISTAAIGDRPDKTLGWFRPDESRIYRTTMITTAGLFELPNYYNATPVRPLLKEEPDLQKGLSYPQNANQRLVDQPNPFVHPQQPNRGPLRYIVEALFGNDSFIADRVADPEAFLAVGYDDPKATCDEVEPLRALTPLQAYESQCVKNRYSLRDIDEATLDWVSLFDTDNRTYRDPSSWTNQSGTQVLQDALAVAGFLAAQAWITYSAEHTFSSYEVYTDPGEDVIIPAISDAGIILGSALLGLQLLLLLSLAVYSSVTPRWSDTLDAFAMMRYGVEHARHLRFAAVGDAEEISVLDELDGRVGDAAGDEHVGVLSTAGTAGLRAKRGYVSM